jgi:hypothetical protein
MRGWVCLLWIGFAFIKCMYRTYSMLLKNLPCVLYTNPLSVQALQSRSCLILLILCYNGSLLTWMVIRLTTAKFKPLIFSVSSFVLSYAENMFILMILFDLCLLPAQFWFMIIYILKVESCVWTDVHLGKFRVVRRTLFCRCCNWKTEVSAAKSNVGHA